MTSPATLLRTRLARPVATALAFVLLGVTLSAGFHGGGHDDLGWLPATFHQHDYGWAADVADAPLPLLDHCLACHLGRTLVRLAPPAPALPEAPAPALGDLAAADHPRPTRPDHTRSPRAPPAS